MRFIPMCFLFLFMIMDTHPLEKSFLLGVDEKSSYQSLSPINGEWIAIDMEENQREYFDESFFNRFPEEILREIAQYIGLKDIAALSTTCQVLNQNRLLAEMKLSCFLKKTNLDRLSYHEELKGPANMLKILAKVLNLKNLETLTKLSCLAGEANNKLIEVRNLAHRYRYSPYFGWKGGVEMLKDLSLKINRNDSLDEFSYADVWYSIKRDPYVLIASRIIVNTVLPGLYMMAGYFFMEYVINLCVVGCPLLAVPGAGMGVAAVGLIIWIGVNMIIPPECYF